MAESVQAVLDSMVPALRDYLDRGIFSESEVRSIVDRRRRSEYLLKRRHARKADFLRYAEDETKLERLRQLRNKRRRQRMADEERRERERRRERGVPKEREEKEKARAERERRWKPSIGDGHIVGHVHFIFTRALRKWREDAELHRAHADFARSVGSWGRLGRIFAEALQAHPKDASLWIDAASHEFFGPPSLHSDPTYDPDDPTDPRNRRNAKLGGSVRSARVLLQRGLRANPSSRELWWQHFCLELHYVQKLRGRREVLRMGLRGADGAPLGRAAADDDEEEGSGGGGGGAVSDAVPLVVYRNAVKAVPDDVAFRLKFVDLSRQFPGTDRLRAEIVRTIEGDFAGSPAAWIARAEYAAEGVGGSSASKGGAAPAGFLAAAAAADDEGGDEGGTPGEKRRRAEDGGEGGDAEEEEEEEEDPAGDVLLRAVRRVPTAEMHLEAVRFVLRRLRSRSGGDDDDDGGGDVDDDADADADAGDDDEEGRRERAGRRGAALLGRLFASASGAGVLGGCPDLVLARADFLLATGDARGAAAALRSACLCETAAAGNDARLWLRWADLAGRLESAGAAAAAAAASGGEATEAEAEAAEAAPPGEGPEDVLRRALGRVPIRGPGHGAVAAALLRRLLLPPPAPPPSPGGGFSGSGRSAGKKGGGRKRRRTSSSPSSASARRRRREEEASALLQRVLVLSDKSGGGDAAVAASSAQSSSSSVVDNAAELCLAYLRRASLDGPDAARAAYDAVLLRSGYAKSCKGMAEAEVRSMAAFFEACLSVERAAATAEGGEAGAASYSEEGRRRVGRIYDAAVEFFREGGRAEGARHYRQRREVDRALRY